MNPAEVKSSWLKCMKASSVGACFCLVISLLSACGMCGEEPIGESRSPNGSYTVNAYVRSCGATTGWTTHANLRTRWSWFSPSWDGTIDDGLVFVNGCWSKINFVWKDDSTLEIQYEKCAPRNDGIDPAWIKHSSWGEVKISYREMPRQMENR